MTAPATLEQSFAKTTQQSRAGLSQPRHRFDQAINLLIILFAFVAASFIARNTDVWLHMAAGRMIADGNYVFGQDPFTYTTTGKYWANHAWLFDLGMYLGYQLLGGAALVGIKAGLVAGIAVLMLLLAWGSGPRWIAAGCVLLAIVAMTPRLLLQPTILSLLLLASVLCCLRAGGRWNRLVPLLIALWVNLDSWFFLGPAVVVLFWAGNRLGNPTGAGWPRWLIPASLLTTLASPHHFHGLALPLELSPAVWSSQFVVDPRFSAVFVSPWQLAPLGAAGGYNLAAWAYFILFALGVISFLLRPRALFTWRGFIWLPFAFLAAWQARLIPFFAVVAGPITAINLQERMAQQILVRTGRLLVCLASLSLIALGSLGWIVGFTNRDRGLAWGLHSDPTLERAAFGIKRWRELNQPEQNARVFPTHPDIAHYMAWHTPGERGFLDSRLTLFTDIIDDYLDLSRAVGLLPDETGARQRLDGLLAKHSIAAVVLYDLDPNRTTNALSITASQQSQNWALLRVDGSAVLIVPKGTPYSRHTFDPERIVFGPPDPNDISPANAGPLTLAEPTPWWLRKPTRGRQGSWEADAATVFLRLFEFLPLEGRALSPALPLLAIRAARRGIEIDPADATAWFILGRAYQGLGERTWEREAGDNLTLLVNLRLLQLTAALVQSALQHPDSVATHDALVSVFLRRQAYDLAYSHAVETLRLTRRNGPSREESPDQYAKRVARLNDFVNQLEGHVQNAENRYVIRTTGMTGEPLNRARIAMELGLFQKAVEVLQLSHPDLYGIEGLGLLAELLVQSGRIAEARVLLDRPELKQNPNALGVATIPGKPHPNGHRWSYRLPAVAWLDLCVAASAGHYPTALQAIDTMNAWLEASERSQEPELRLQFLRMLGLEVGQGLPAGRTWAWVDTSLKRSQWGELLAHVKFLSVARADLHTIAGLLELERGQVAAAGHRLLIAQQLYDAARGYAPSLPGAALTARYLEVLRKHSAIP
jgi:tetratricopeptide (TPR) repeat protein